ncbi:MAG TPA: family 1 encapsulin nanocompartment shell protein [bacterium]|nr:family 1 encapsulin nanocompartment shell protein [bacterium]
MGSDLENRGSSGIGNQTWEVLERAAVGAAMSQLSARRFISIEGPHGLGVQAVPLSDEHSPDGHAVARLLPLHYIFRTFGLSLRDIAVYEREPLMLDAGPAVRAAIECARAEEELIFTGTKNAPGLTAAPGIVHHKLTSWRPLSKAATDVVDAVNLLDAAGFHGPYALALEPARYNLLYRLYPDGNGTELAHIEKIVGGGVFKSPALKTGGILLATGAQFSTIVIGQDLSVGYVGRVGPDVQLSVSESIALLLREPKAVCALEE